MMISYANGIHIPTEQLALPFVDDPIGTLRGYRIFTACRTVRGKVFRLDDHVNRLFDSAETMYMNMPHTREEIFNIIQETVEKNKGHAEGDLLVEILLSGGSAGENGFSPKGNTHLYVIALPLKMWPARFYRHGIALASYPYERQFASVKLLNYVGGVIAHQTVVKKHNAQDALFVSVDKPHYVLEGTTFNFSVVKDGVIYTHPFDGRILAGITLKVTLMLARRMGTSVKEERMAYESLKEADESFITSSTRNVLPVTRVDDMVIGTGVPGTITMRLMEGFGQYVASY